MNLTMPTINLVFRQKASTAVARSQKGTVAYVICDAAAAGGDQQYELRSTAQIPEGLGVENQNAVRRIFEGGAKKVLLYVQNAGVTVTSGSACLKWLATQKFDYLALHGEATTNENKAIKEWIVKQRQDMHAIYKAVLADTVADSEAIINFTASDIKVDEKTYTAAQYCGRIAGLIAGTPMSQSVTYAVLPEVDDIKRQSSLEMDTAVGAGKLVLYHDGEKVKLGRGVNSLTTTSGGKSDLWKKIKIVELLDMIQQDLRLAIEDQYIGKFPNNYPNKQLLVTAVTDYLAGLEKDGLIEPGFTCGIDLDAQDAYLQEHGTPTADMSADEIAKANTGSHVFLNVGIVPVDAMEDVDTVIYLPVGI